MGCNEKLRHVTATAVTNRRLGLRHNAVHTGAERRQYRREPRNAVKNAVMTPVTKVVVPS